jgi:hypothetical protein
MADFFLVHDRAIFEDRLRPALSAAWHQRSFAPCLSLLEDWEPVARDYAERYRVNPDDILLLQLDKGLVFDRAFWRSLAGELLLFAATEIPEFPNCFDTLLHLLAPAYTPIDEVARNRRPPIYQALHGSRDVAFGATLYRAEHAGLNHSEDVVRLAKWLGAIRTESWTTADLASIPGLEDEEDRAEELAFAREWYPVLVDLYRRTADAGRILVLERIF